MYRRHQGNIKTSFSTTTYKVVYMYPHIFRWSMWKYPRYTIEPSIRDIRESQISAIYEKAKYPRYTRKPCIRDIRESQLSAIYERAKYPRYTRESQVSAIYESAKYPRYTREPSKRDIRESQVWSAIYEKAKFNCTYGSYLHFPLTNVVYVYTIISICI